MIVFVVPRGHHKWGPHRCHKINLFQLKKKKMKIWHRTLFHLLEYAHST